LYQTSIVRLRVSSYEVVKIVKTTNTIATSTEYRTRAFILSAIWTLNRFKVMKTIGEDRPVFEKNDSLYTNTYLKK
jgi:hypothetical protein